MGTKTYTSASISNLNSSGKEFRAGKLSILEGSLANWQHVKQGYHLQKTQLGGQGVNFRNWIYWAREYKLSGYNDPIIGNEDKTYNELIDFYEPQVSSVVDISDGQLDDFIEHSLKLPIGIEELENSSITLMGKLPDGTFKEVTLTGRVRKTSKYKVIDSYSGAYAAEKLGESYIWNQYDKYLKDSKFIKRHIITDGEKKGYLVIPGDNLSSSGENDTVVDQQGNWYDCWLQLGYEFEEPHEDENGKPVTETIFNAETNTYVKVKSLVPAYDYYFTLWGYSYNSIELDSKQFNIDKDGYLVLDGNGNPTKYPPVVVPPTEEYKPEWKVIKTLFKIEYEDWEKTVKEEYITDINLSSIKGFNYLNSLDNASKDPYIGNTVNPDIKNISSYMTPIVCFRNNKSWMSKDPDDFWFQVNTKALKKLNKKKDYYSEMYEELHKQITQGDVAWVYLIYGLPANYAQTDYGAHYALQFFKQLTVPNWNKYVHGAVGKVNGKGVGYTYGSRRFNCHFSFSIGNTIYECGKGQCPAPGYSNIRGGESGVCKYNGLVTFWNQSTSTSWEYISITGYSTSFSWIKNGKGASPGGADWFLPLWKKENVERQFSPCIIPLMWQVGKNIPFTDWTDVMQFCPHVAATAYKVVKTKWYQSGIFKVILSIVMIVVSVVIIIYTGGIATGPAASIGSAIAGVVGGSTTFWSAVAAVAISTAVGIAVNAIITPLLQQAFGPVIGAVLGSIVSILATSFTTVGLISPDAFLDELMQPLTWLKLGNSAVNGYAQLIQKQTGDVQNEMYAFQQKAEEKQDEILAHWAELGGKIKNTWALKRIYGAATGNAMDNCVVETGDQFLARCITNCVNAWENSIYVLEHYPELTIENSVEPAVMFGGIEPPTTLA